jgi:DNA-binding NarL/FixJ family response regulator
VLSAYTQGFRHGSQQELQRRALADDAAILDLTVRGAMGGREAVRALRALDPEVRAVVMSGHSDDQVMQEYSQHGFKGALTKPFDREVLLDVLSRVLSD